MVTISLCMIVKNEEAVLARCLDSVKDAVDEIIIADTGSTDNTVAIARRYTQKVFSYLWSNDFSKARNYAYSQATMDYQLWLDADDILEPEQLEKLKQLKATLSPTVDMVTMLYHTHLNADGTPLSTTTRERLTKTARGYRWIDAVHECIPLQGNIFYSDIAVTHSKSAAGGDPERNLRIYEELLRAGAPFTPRQRYYYARELKDHGRWAEAAEQFLKFLASDEGWAEDNIAACFDAAVCLRELGAENQRLSPLLRSFSYGTPRAEICCELGYYYKSQGDTKQAVDWFLFAAGLEPPPFAGFILQDYWGYIPNLELCVLFDAQGDREKARHYNEQAARYKPDSAAVAYNRAYFASLE